VRTKQKAGGGGVAPPFQSLFETLPGGMNNKSFYGGMYANFRHINPSLILVAKAGAHPSGASGQAPLEG